MVAARKLRVAVVGCGQIADAHLGEIRKLPSAELVATCDTHLDLAEQAAARFDVPASFDSLETLLARTSPDVVHLTTPPQTHQNLTLAALNAGAHVYVEKPFAVDAVQAASMLAAAAARSRKICVGHDQLFDPIWLECRRRYDAGDFGDIVHIDSVMGYDLSGAFGALLAEDPEHWVHRLPGGLFQNNISHALYRITDFMPDQRPHIRAHWFATSTAPGFPSELRVMLQGRQMTGTILFSSTARPVQRVARLYGTRAVVEVDLDGQTLRVRRPPDARGPFVKLQIPWRDLREAQRAWTHNVRRFLRSDLQYFGGMARLFALFYDSILQEGEPPISPGEIQRVTSVMDEIFRVCADDAGGAAVV